MEFMDDKDYSARDIVTLINSKFGPDKEWPKTIGVTAATFGRICQWIFTQKIINNDNNSYCQSADWLLIPIALGKADFGIMFKNVEFVISHS